MNKLLRKQIRKVVASYSGPVTYAQIEAGLPKQGAFVLALELGEMIAAGLLYFAAPASLRRSHPVYSLTPFKRQPRFPVRAIAAEVEDE